MSCSWLKLLIRSVSMKRCANPGRMRGLELPRSGWWSSIATGSVIGLRSSPIGHEARTDAPLRLSQMELDVQYGAAQWRARGADANYQCNCLPSAWDAVRVGVFVHRYRRGNHGLGQVSSGP